MKKVILNCLVIAAIVVAGCNKNDKSEPKTFAVVFDCNGGSAVSEQTVTEGERATEPTPPTQTGHTFAGWYTDSLLILNRHLMILFQIYYFTDPYRFYKLYFRLSDSG